MGLRPPCFEFSIKIFIAGSDPYNDLRSIRRLSILCLALIAIPLHQRHMKLQPFKIALTCTFIFSAFTVMAQEMQLIAPISGTSTFIGKQMVKGSGQDAADDACKAETAATATDTALKNGARFIYGLPCIEALDAAADRVVASDDDAIILALGVEVDDITNRDKRAHWPVFRLGPKTSDEAVIIGEYLKASWRDKPFAIIDDGTLYGRQLAQDVRALLEDDNLTPVFTDTYRPLLERQAGLVRRIVKSGATHVFVGGDAYDVSIMGTDAQAIGADLVFAGGSAFLAPPADGTLPEGALFAGLSDVSKSTDGAYFAALAKAASQIGTQSLNYAKDNDTTMARAMTAQAFETDLGLIRFDLNGENDRQWFSVFEVKDGKPTPIQENNG